MGSVCLARETERFCLCVNVSACVSVCVINVDTFAVFLVDLHGHVAEEIL